MNDEDYNKWNWKNWMKRKKMKNEENINEMMRWNKEEKI